MNFLSRLERSLGWITVGNLPLYVVTAQAILFVWLLLHPEDVMLFNLDPIALFEAGQYWRLLTFLFIPPQMHWLFTILFLYFLYICGSALESAWGSFPLTLFYFTGAVGAFAAALLGGGALNSSFYLNETVFLAFAALFPNFIVYMFFVIPLKVKWLAWFGWVAIGIQVFEAPSLYKVAILLSVSNYFIFFAKHHYDTVAAYIRRTRYKDRMNW